MANPEHGRRVVDPTETEEGERSGSGWCRPRWEGQDREIRGKRVSVADHSVAAISVSAKVG